MASPRSMKLLSSAAWLSGVAWSIGLIVFFMYAPVYDTASTTLSGETVHGTETLMDENGRGALVVLVVPLVIALLVGVALLLRSHRGAMWIAWGLTGILAVFNGLALLSIGIAVVPVTATLILACATAPTTPGDQPSMPSAARAA